MEIEKIQDKNIRCLFSETPSYELQEKVDYCLKNPIIQRQEFELVKKGNQREIYKVKLNSRIYYFKKYRYRSLNKRVKIFFRKSPAFRSFKISQKLIEAGIPVVKPVIAAEYKQKPTIVDSLFVTEDFDGVNLQDFLAFEDYSQAEKEEIIKVLAELWAGLYQNKYINGDPNLPGVLLKFDGDLKLSFVDVDNFKRKIYLSEKRIIKNLAKFNAHSYSGLAKMDGKELTISDRKLFLKTFIKNYSFKLSRRRLIEKIDELTFELLKSWRKEDLI